MNHITLGLLAAVTAGLPFSYPHTLTDVPHHDATPNHLRHLEQVRLEAAQKRQRKLARKTQNAPIH